MSNKKEVKLPPLEEGLLRAMKALDSQIARAMSRTPSQREEHGVQKWEPYSERVERVCILVMQALGEREVELDSVIVLAQAFSKALNLLADDLGEKGLGKMRTNYVLSAAKSILTDAERISGSLGGTAEVM